MATPSREIDPGYSEPPPVSDTPKVVRAGASPQKHFALFLATLTTVFMAGAIQDFPKGVDFSLVNLLLNLHHGWRFAVPLMAILVTHEFGHYFAAKYHGVPASLPYFIPLPPPLSPLGTMGAVISMPQRIKSRNALLDIGAAGPLAGMVVAIPVLLIGLAQSQVKPLSGTGMMEGQCLLYSLLKYAVHGPIAPGYDVTLTSTAFAGWVGLLLTMLNLLPIGQLDGGHIAYALFGDRQDRVAGVLHVGLVAAFVYNLWLYGDITPGLVWLVWFALLAGLRRLSGGMNHPPTEPGPLSPMRRRTAVACLVLFVLLFMPTPMRMYGVANEGLVQAVQQAVGG
jgi:membrane-associated protease RseP (regulator of RpoE activity)